MGGADIAEGGRGGYAALVGLWSRFVRALSARPLPPLALRVAVEQARNQRRALALLEVREEWLAERVDRFEAELEKWERRLPLADTPELRGQVRAFVEVLHADVARVGALLRTARTMLEAAEDSMMSTAASFVVRMKAAEGFGFDVSGLSLDMDVDALRQEAREQLQGSLVAEVPSEARDFVDELFRRREASRARYLA